ncbi:MAG: DUF3108 domain-containing protein [Xanthobacteraceae bacterium]
MSIRRAARSLVFVVPVGVAFFSAGGPGHAGAQGKLEARYVASLAGVPIGKGQWVIDVADDQYTATASGKTTGLMQVFAAGLGSAAGRGTVNGGKPVSSSYAATIASDKKTDEVRMAVSSGNVKEYSAEPAWPQTPDRVPVTETHRRGIVDPMSAILMAVAGNGDSVRPEACQRTLAIFDGRGRFDLILSFKRMDHVRSVKGYEGPVVVCAVRYHPISGHRPNRAAIKYLIEQRDMEMALAPVAGTRVLVPYRVSVPTALGPAVLEAVDFVTGPQTGRASPAATNARTF